MHKKEENRSFFESFSQPRSPTGVTEAVRTPVSGTLWHGFESYQWVKNQVDPKGLAAMLAVKGMAVIAPEMNLRIAQATKHTREVSILALKPRAHITRIPKRSTSNHTK